MKWWLCNVFKMLINKLDCMRTSKNPFCSKCKNSLVTLREICPFAFQSPCLNLSLQTFKKKFLWNLTAKNFLSNLRAFGHNDIKESCKVRKKNKKQEEGETKSSTLALSLDKRLRHGHTHTLSVFLSGEHNL